ncbi:MAG TPA: RcpC/CpaB family pilus assembly protein [Kineosporiaceae bacterium]|nr:RcpC/CpaB family pilus assembly protein [Kineosporiaceae bacterium]
MNRRIVALAVAGVCALVAGVAVVLYASGADQRALAGQQPASAWVTTHDIPRATKLGEAVKQGWLRKETLPERAVPATAVQNLGADDLLATSDISAGEVLLDGRFSQQRIGPEVVSVPAGHLAVSAELTDAGRVASFVRPGDDVAVFYAPKGGGLAYVLLPRVQVLGTGMSTETGAVSTDDSSKDTKVSSQVMTLALTPKESAKLVAAAADTNAGSLYFGLLPSTTDVPADTLATALPQQFSGLQDKLLRKVESTITEAVKP